MVAIAGLRPCAGHDCDGCKLCRTGTCCRRDAPGYALPDAGTWPGAYAGQLGRMAYDEHGRPICHICGEGFESLASHLGAHGTWAGEYRAFFGLNRGQSLYSLDLRRRLAENGARPVALEALAKGRAAIKGWPKGKRGAARLQARLQRPPNPPRRQALKPDIELVCTACERTFSVPAGAYKRKTCSPECVSEAIRRANRERKARRRAHRRKEKAPPFARTRHREEQAARLIEAGAIVSFKQLGAEIGLSDSGARSLVQRIGIRLNKPPRTPPPWQPPHASARRREELAVALIERGEVQTFKQLGSTIGLSPSGARALLKRLGLRLPTPVRVRAERRVSKMATRPDAQSESPTSPSSVRDSGPSMSARCFRCRTPIEVSASHLLPFCRDCWEGLSPTEQGSWRPPRHRSLA